jgi:hypothetical protein
MPGKVFPFEEFKTGVATGADKRDILSVIVFIFMAVLLIENINARQNFPLEEFETGAAAGADKCDILSVAVFIFRRYY